jgi:hypothetical protein
MLASALCCVTKLESNGEKKENKYDAESTHTNKQTGTHTHTWRGRREIYIYMKVFC